MSNKLRLFKIGVGAAVFILGMFLKNQSFWMFLIAYLIIGGDVLYTAVRNIFHGEVFDENFLMSIATIGAFAIGEYPEGVAVMLFYQVGEYFQEYSVNKSRKSIADLMNIRPDFANVLRGDDIFKVEPEEIKIDDVIIVRPGERIPLDGQIIEGSTTIDTSALTGEALPRENVCGDDVLSGCINLSGLIKVKVSKEYSESTISKILDLVENASSKKSKSENFITKFARIYTPAVVAAALLIAIIPPLLSFGTFSEWIYTALTFLVISCPCALVISVPMSFFGGIGGASRVGILVKGSNYLEALSYAETVVFDKTGTLTKGVFKVTEISALTMTSDELLKLTTYAENYSNHPISISLKKAYDKEIDTQDISDIEEIAGHGIKAKVGGREVFVGNKKLMEKMNIDYKEVSTMGTIIYVAVDYVYSGYIVISDELKDDAKYTIKALKDIGIKQTIMLSGDIKSIGEKIAKELSIDKAYTELLPQDKVEKFEELVSQKQNGSIVFVGDGINDAPVLARADIGIAMGGLGSDAAIEAADIVIMTDEPSKLITAIGISKRTIKIVKQNIIFALSVKLLVLFLGVFSIASMWWAVFADVGVSVIAILNAMRAMKVK